MLYCRGKTAGQTGFLTPCPTDRNHHIEFDSIKNSEDRWNWGYSNSVGIYNLSTQYQLPYDAWTNTPFLRHPNPNPHSQTEPPRSSISSSSLSPSPPWARRFFPFPLFFVSFRWFARYSLTISEIAQSAGKRFRVRYIIFERVWTLAHWTRLVSQLYWGVNWSKALIKRKMLASLWWTMSRGQPAPLDGGGRKRLFNPILTFVEYYI